MTQKEALLLALEVLQDLEDTNSYWWQEVDEVTLKQMESAINAIKAALANEALERKAENARELGLDYELKEKNGYE